MEFDQEQIEQATNALMIEEDGFRVVSDENALAGYFLTGCALMQSLHKRFNQRICRNLNRQRDTFPR